MSQEVIRTWDDAQGLDPRQPALLEVPGEWVRGVVGLLMISQEYKESGLIVTNLGPSGAAARAGIARGDILLRYNGVELDTVARLREITGRTASGEKAKIEGIRGSLERQFEVEAGRLGVTVSAPLNRLKLVTRSQTSLKTHEPILVRSWRPL